MARLDVTGSAARGNDFDPATSDVDFIVEFLPEAKVNAFDFVALENDLGSILRRRIDLIEIEAVRNARVRDLLASDRVRFYAAA